MLHSPSGRAGGLRPLVSWMAGSTQRLEVQRAAALALYQISCATTTHAVMVGVAPPSSLGRSKVAPPLEGALAGPADGLVAALCALGGAGEMDTARLAVMALANVAASKGSRLEASRNGGLQCAVTSASSEDLEVILTRLELLPMILAAPKPLPAPRRSAATPPSPSRTWPTAAPRRRYLSFDGEAGAELAREAPRSWAACVSCSPSRPFLATECGGGARRHGPPPRPHQVASRHPRAPRRS